MRLQTSGKALSIIEEWTTLITQTSGSSKSNVDDSK